MTRLLGGEGVSPDGYLNMNTETFFYLNSLTDKTNNLQRVSDSMALAEVCALQVLLVVHVLL